MYGKKNEQTRNPNKTRTYRNKRRGVPATALIQHPVKAAGSG